MAKPLGALFPQDNRRTVMGIAGNQGPPVVPGTNVYTPAAEAMRAGVLTVPEAIYQGSLMARYGLDPANIPQEQQGQFNAYLDEYSRREQIRQQYPEIWDTTRFGTEMIADPTMALGKLFKTGGAAGAFIIPPLKNLTKSKLGKAVSGVFTGPDGIPRIEFPDSSMKVRADTAWDDFRPFPNGDFPTQPIRRFIDHPMLDEIAPGVMDNLEITLSNKLNIGEANHVGSRARGANRIEISAKHFDEQGQLKPEHLPELRDSLMHEIQHEIQDQYGMSRGGSMSNITQPERKAFTENVRTVKPELAKRYDSVLKKYENMQKLSDDDLQDLKTIEYGAYNQLLGELEASYVGKRASLTPEQMRDATYGFFLRTPRKPTQPFTDLQPATTSPPKFGQGAGQGHPRWAGIGHPSVQPIARAGLPTQFNALSEQQEGILNTLRQLGYKP